MEYHIVVVEDNPPCGEVPIVMRLTVCCELNTREIMEIFESVDYLKSYLDGGEQYLCDDERLLSNEWIAENDDDYIVESDDDGGFIILPKELRGFNVEHWDSQDWATRVYELANHLLQCETDGDYTLNYGFDDDVIRVAIN